MRMMACGGLILLAPLGEGCLHREPIGAWQERIERNIIDQGNGDPSVLFRQTTSRNDDSLRPAPIIVGELDIPGFGIPPLATHRDVQAVLVGRPRIDNVPWYVFVAGVIRRDPRPLRAEYYATAVEDIRLIGLNVDGKRFTWRASRRDPQAVARYLAGGANGSSKGAATFPADTDIFRLKMSEGEAVVTADPSGASWELDLTPGN